MQLGLVTGKDLAYQVGKNYPRGGRVLLWILLEISLLVRLGWRYPYW